MTDDVKEFTMRHDLKIMILNAFLVGGLGGYAVTRWGTVGAFGGVALALVRARRAWDDEFFPVVADHAGLLLCRLTTTTSKRRPKHGTIRRRRGL